MQDAEALSEQWQIQAQAALGQLERLKDMLAESASWAREPADISAAEPEAPRPSDGGGGADVGGAVAPREGTDDVPAGPAPGQATAQLHGGAAPGAEAHAGVAAAPQQCSTCAAREQQIAEQRAELAELDVQMRAMRAEVLRSTQLASQVGRSVLPALYSIESRLMEASS